AAQNVAGVAAVAFVLAVLLHEALFLGRGLVPADGILQYLPWSATWQGRPSNYLLSDQYNILVPLRQFLHDELWKGRFPLWNPHHACGVPTLASMQGAMLYPINLLLMPLRPFTASGLAAFLKLALAGTFTLLYMRRVGVALGPALLAAIVYPL